MRYPTLFLACGEDRPSNREKSPPQTSAFIEF